MRIPNWTKKESAALWQEWMAEFKSFDDAVAHAVWCGNRLCKSHAQSKFGKRRFYSVKDQFIRLYGGDEARAIRLETRDCIACGGLPSFHLEYPCDRCGGSGIYASRWLYSYNFEVEGQAYNFHSYLAPKVVVASIPGYQNDDYDFGGRFNDEELKALRLPWSGIMRILAYVARAVWQMDYDFLYGVYLPPATKGDADLREKERREALTIRALMESGKMSWQKAQELRRIHKVS